MTGAGQIIATGSQEQVDAIMGDVDSGYSGIGIFYTDADGIDCNFDVLLKDKVSGDFMLEKISATSVKMTFSGVAKISVSGAALKEVLKSDANWKIGNLTGGYYSMNKFTEDSSEGIKLSKSAPK